MRTRETREVQVEESRPKRVPLHEQRRNRLTIKGRDPAYHYRIVNDVGTRVEEFKQAGYEIAPKEHKVGDVATDESNISLGGDTRIVVDKEGGRAVLMRIKNDLYEADQKAKQRDISEKEKMLLRKATKGEDGTYGGLSMEVKETE